MMSGGTRPAPGTSGPGTGHNGRVIVDWAVYRRGQRQQRAGDLADALASASRGGPDAEGFVWIGLYEPSHAELSQVEAEFGLHRLAVEDAVKAHQRPKVERYDDSLFVVLKTLRYIEETSAIQSGEVALFLGPHYCVTVRHGPANPLSEVRAKLEREHEELLACGPSAVLYAVCDAVVDTYTAIAAEVEHDIEEVEAQVFSPQRTNDAEAVYKLKREVLEFRRAVRPLAEPMARLADGLDPLVHKDTQPFFRDVHDHVLRVTEQVESFDDLLTGILNANLAQVSVRQNADMRRISAWVAIVAVPTMIAGIYGMNFEHMPELTWRYGYPLAVALMLVVCVALYRAFKRSGWL
jgi:magnesium transporter